MYMNTKVYIVYAHERYKMPIYIVGIYLKQSEADIRMHDVMQEGTSMISFVNSFPLSKSCNIEVFTS